MSFDESDVRYWVPDEEEAWIPGTKLSNGSYKTVKGTKHVDEELEIVDPESFSGVEDICTLSTISHPAILQSLRARYARNEIYTNISSILIAINPFQQLNMYSSEHIQLYQTATDRRCLPPHLFGVCADAYSRLATWQKSQALLISGESGAGKTESTKFVLLYLSEALRSKAGLADKLLEINPVLEAFGNAKTIRNNNSSRFGKWIEVAVHPATKTLAGATVTEYLLEETRVNSQGSSDRNYHIFYQLASKACQEAHPEIEVKDAMDFNYLNKNPARVEGTDDEQGFFQLQDALASLGFTAEEEECIVHIPAGILHLGNILFDSAGDGSTVQDEAKLAMAARVLRVSEEGLRKVLCQKLIKSGVELIESPLSPEKACQARDSFARMIYGRLFKWLISRCNIALGLTFGGEDVLSKPFFGVLDIAGFEIFEVNQLEQLFINLSNEKLQQYFNQFVFKQEFKEYEEEGVPFDRIKFHDNADVLQLIEGTGGILLMLDDASTGVKQTDIQYTEKLIRQHEKNPKFLKPAFTKNQPLQFGVKHYAGEVMYTTEKFLEKNLSVQPAEMMELMRSSGLSVLSLSASDQSGEKAGPTKKATVGSTFRRSLAKLIEKLGNAEANFVRCLKPNQEKVPAKYTAPTVLQQLLLTGVMETVRIRKAGFQVKIVHEAFCEHFLVVVERDARKRMLAEHGSSKDFCVTSDADMKAFVDDMLTYLLKEFEAMESVDVCVGKTKIFMRGAPFQILDAARRHALIAPSVAIQAHWRGYRTRVVFKETVEVNDALRRCVVSAGVSKHIDSLTLKKNLGRATVMHDSLTAMDLLLGQAMKLPIKLPSLPLYMKARSALEAQAKLARQVSDALTSLDLPYLEALLARTKAHEMSGALIEQAKERKNTIGLHLQMRRWLMDGTGYEVLEDAKACVEEAKRLGLDVDDAWLLHDGPSYFKAVVKRVEQLEATQNEKCRAIADLEEKIGNVASSLDVSGMQALLLQSTTLNMRGDMVDAFSQFVTAARSFQKFRDASVCVSTEVSADEINRKLEDGLVSTDFPTMRHVLKSAECCDNADKALVNKLKARCENYVNQITLRKELQDCATSDDIAFLDKAIASVSEFGLQESSELWLFEDGPLLTERVVSRRKRWEKVIALQARITTASSTYDVKTLQGAFTELSEMGIPLSRFEEDYQLFLLLQDSVFVEARSKELRLFCDECDMDELASIANLAQQLNELGTRVDSAGMEDVAKMFAHARVKGKRTKVGQLTPLQSKADDSRNQDRVHGDQAPSRPVSAAMSNASMASRSPSIGMNSAAVHAAIHTVFEDLSNFCFLRDPLEWGITAPGEAAPAKLRSDMVSFSSECITEPLTKLSADFEQAAVSNFMNIMRHMGDKPNVTSGGQLEEPIIDFAGKSSSTGDEVYVQIMKQLTNNPSMRSASSGWSLFGKVCQKAPISNELIPFVKCFLERASQASPGGRSENIVEKESSLSRKRLVEARLSRKSIVNFDAEGRPSLAATALVSFLTNLHVGEAPSGELGDGIDEGSEEEEDDDNVSNGSRSWQEPAVTLRSARFVGALKKKSPMWYSGWQVRWFHILGRRMYYWKSRRDAERGSRPWGTISLEDAIIKQNRGVDSSVFQLRAATRTYEFDANVGTNFVDNVHSAQEWITAIADEISRKSRQ